VQYKYVNQPRVAYDLLLLKPDQTFNLSLRFNRGELQFSGETTFTTPKPNQPHASWTWDGDNWQPPVAYPTDGGMYQWDESTTSWVAVEQEQA
jgi:hypothetical protein